MIILSLPGGSAAASSGEAWIEALRAGGYVLFIPRGGARVEPALDHAPPPRCPSGTRLTRAGWETALKTGVGLVNRGVQVEEVYASPVCASRHTAYLLFGADKVRLDPALVAGCDSHAGPTSAHRRAVARYLSTPPVQAGFNRAVVGRGCLLDGVAAAHWPVCARRPSAGDVVIFRPLGDGFDVAGCLPFAALKRWSGR